MGKTIKLKKTATKVEVLNRIANIEPLSQKKAFKMKNKMLTAFKELKHSQNKLKSEHEGLVFARNELKIWQDNYVKLFNLAPVGYFTVYKDMIVKEVNDAAIEMLGYDKFQIIGQPIVVHADHSCRDELRHYFATVFETGSASIELTMITNDDKPLDVFIHAALVSEDTGSLPCCICAVMDRTKINNLRSKLQEHKDQLDELADRHATELNKVFENQLAQHESSQQEKSDLNDQLEQLQDSVQRKADEIESIKQLNHQLQQDLENVCIVKDKFADKCDEYEALVKEQAFDLAGLKGQLEQAIIENDRLIKLHSEHDQHKQQSFENQESLKHQIDHLENKLQNADQNNSRLKAQITVLNQQIKDEKAKADLEKQKLASMVRQRAKKINELIKRIETIKSQTGSIIDDLQKRLDDTERVLGGRVNELTIINEKLQNQLSAAREEFQTHRSKANFLEKQYIQSQSELTAAQKEIEVQQERVKQSEQKRISERDELVKSLSEKSDQLDMLNEAYLQQQKDINTLSESIEQKDSLNGSLQAALDQNRMMLKRLCDVGAISMNVYDLKNRKMAYVNRHIGEVLGYDQKQIDQLGEEIVSKIMHPDDLQRISADLSGFKWESPDEVIDIEYRLQDAQGTWRYIQSQEVVLSCDENGKPEKVLGIQYDFTEKVQAREGMKALAKIVAMVGKE